MLPDYYMFGPPQPPSNIYSNLFAGSHRSEYDFGLKGLNKALHESDKDKHHMMEKYHISLEPSTCKWISTNIDGADGKPIAGCETKVLVDWHGVQVGIISVSENWLPGCSKIKTEGSVKEAIWLNDVEEATKVGEDQRDLRRERGIRSSRVGIDGTC